MIVSDNQVYVRGDCDPNVTGDPAHRAGREPHRPRQPDPQLRHGHRHRAAPSRSVGEVIDPQTFLVAGTGRAPGAAPVAPLPRLEPGVAGRHASRRRSRSSSPSTPRRSGSSSAQPRDDEGRRRFEVFPPSANWSIHDNTITGCLKPVVLDSHGSADLAVQGQPHHARRTAGVKAAIDVRGSFKLIGNHVSGFDEKDSAALSLAADPLGRTARSVYRANVFQGCAQSGAGNPEGVVGRREARGQHHHQVKNSVSVVYRGCSWVRRLKSALVLLVLVPTAALMQTRPLKGTNGRAGAFRTPEEEKGRRNVFF